MRMLVTLHSLLNGAELALWVLYFVFQYGANSHFAV